MQQIETGEQSKHSGKISFSTDLRSDYSETRLSDLPENDIAYWSHLISESGVNRDTRGIPLYDPNPDMTQYVLRGFRYDHGIYHRILTYDGTSRGVFTFISGEILRARVRVQEPTNATPEEKKATKLARWILGLLDGVPSPIEGGLRGLLWHAVQSLPYGFSITEGSWAVSDFDGELALHPSRYRWLAPWSIKGWLWLNGSPVAFIQTAPSRNNNGHPALNGRDTVDVIVPLSKCLLFQHQAVDGNPEGFSINRTSLPWFDAKFSDLYRDQTSAAKLSDGLFVVQEMGDEHGPYRGNGKEDGKNLSKMIKAVREGRTNTVCAPYGLNLDVKWPKYGRPDGTNAFKYYDHQILSCALANILGLDSSAAATRGISEGMSAIAFHMIETIADGIADVINGNGRIYTGAISKTVHANIPNYKGRIPRAEFTNIRYVDPEKMVKILSNGAQFRLFTPVTNDEIDFREDMRLLKMTANEIEEARGLVNSRNVQASQSGTQGKQKQPLKPGENPSKGEEENEGKKEPERK